MKITPVERMMFNVMKANGKTPGSFDAFLNKKDELRHAYDKFRFEGDVYRQEFDDVYQTVFDYIATVLPRAN